MKIAFDHLAFTMQRHGGISRYFSKLAFELSGLDQEIKIFAGIYQNHYLSKLPKELVRGTHIKSFPKKTGTIFDYFNHFLTQEQIYSYSPDIIHETYYAFAKPKKSDVPRVVTAYDMIHELFPSSFKKNDPLTQNKKNAFNRADHIISISQSTKDDLMEIFSIPDEKISVIYLASDILSGQNPSKISANSKPFLLYVGSREPYKNFELLLKAFSISPSLKNDFEIIAFGGGKFRDEEVNKINELRLNESNVRQVAGDDKVLGALYSSATAFIYPSLYEGFGLPPLEAMSYNCPVISSNTSSMPEVIGNAGEFFDPTSVEELILAIENVVFSESRILDLKEKGRIRILDFSWSKCAKQTLEVYNNLV